MVHYDLARAQFLNSRINITYGDIKNGKAWDENPRLNSGYVGCTTGPLREFILLHNKRSNGGGAILTDCILQIKYSNKKYGGVIYGHPNFKGYGASGTAG